MPVDGFKWVENTSQFGIDFIENYNEESAEGYLSDVDVQYPQQLQNFNNDLPFIPERMKIEARARIEKKNSQIH